MIALEVVRRWPSEMACEGELLLDGSRECWTLEDPPRGLHSGMALEAIHRLKVYGETAIPTGRYPIVLYASPKHGPDTLALVGVPGFDHIQIHAANKAEELLGCISVGLDPGAHEDDWIGRSGQALKALKGKIVPRMKAGEECWVTIREEFAAG